ncbi:MAG: type IIA DNA topoisomerase subunit B [Mycoplasmataceae bacterium]|nr:type IIA DNA topoisomerase subunit B [Mycoplasmataceae bacterium]
MENNNDKYGQGAIDVLENLESVRLRPGMYIGNVTSTGLHHLVWEIVDNAIDEVLAGYGNNINVTLHKDGSVEVQDFGRGIPVGIHRKTGVPTVQTIFTVLHAGGKFGGDGSAYKVSGGLHGVGSTVTNALSKYLEVDINKNGKKYNIRFENGGSKITPLVERGETNETGTTVRFKPDPEIFETVEFDEAIILGRLKQTAYLNKGLIINFANLNNNNKVKFEFAGGIVDFVTEINSTKTKISEHVIYNEAYDEKSGVSIEVALQYTTSVNSNVMSYVNNIRTTEGGTHELGFFDAALRIFQKYANHSPKTRKIVTEKILREDVKEGATIVISIKHPNPLFEGQTKSKLGNSEVRKIVNETISNELEKFLFENPEEAMEIMQKMNVAAKSRLAAQKARESVRRKNNLESSTLPGKLADCSSKDPEVSELFIVEGDSAGGSAKMGRNRETQAILPLRGKVINSEKNRIEKILANNEITSIISAIGAGVGEAFNLEKLRYKKIIIMTDADVDGAHIRTLLLTFFYRYLPILIEEGNLYIAEPPLYKIHKGKEAYYAYNDIQKDEILEKYPGKNFIIQRYKGLGEMNYDQLWETTMDPEVRSLYRVDIDDVIMADNIITALMGEDTESRKKIIKENAKEVEILEG